MGRKSLINSLGTNTQGKFLYIVPSQILCFRRNSIYDGLRASKWKRDPILDVSIFGTTLMLSHDLKRSVTESIVSNRMLSTKQI